MRTVRDAEGDRYLLLKQSGESSLVRDPATGETRHLPNEALEPVDGESPLATAAGRVPQSVRTLLSAVRDDRSLGLLVTLLDRGPTPVRTLLAVTDLCESDLHGTLAEFRAAGLVEERSVAGERGYAATETAERALALVAE
jgi:hypothetical protein